VATSETTKKSKSLTAKIAKVDGLEWLLFQKQIMDSAHNRRTTQFFFTNNGAKPLIITNTQGSCGCTVPTSQRTNCSRDKGIIGVKYATDRVGRSLKQ
jgi:hypothetical protein